MKLNITFKNIFIGIIGVLCSTFLVFAGVFLYHKYDRTYCPRATRASALTLPEYKNAQQTTVKRETKEPGYYAKHFEFTTRDSPETVVSFYKDALINSGWKLVTQEDNTLLSLNEKKALPVYGVTFSISASGIFTKVDVLFSSMNYCGYA